MSIKRKRVTSALRTLFIKNNPIEFIHQDIVDQFAIKSRKPRDVTKAVTVSYTDYKLYCKHMAQRRYKDCMKQYSGTLDLARFPILANIHLNKTVDNAIADGRVIDNRPPVINHVITAMKINDKGHVEGTVVAKKCVGCKACKQTKSNPSVFTPSSVSVERNRPL